MFNKYNLIEDINMILAEHKIDTLIQYSDIIVTNDTVTSHTLSHLVINKIFPSINYKTVYHYTSKETAESIINSNIFRLYSLIKRYSEEEFKTFCKKQQLDGYLAPQDDTNNNPVYKSLMYDMYYASFTDINLTLDQERYFQRTFGSVRLKLCITAKNPDFRKMQYENKKEDLSKLHNQLVKMVNNKYGKSFILCGISRLCAFYLPHKYGQENEYRILYKYFKEHHNILPKSDGGTIQYIELPLNQMNEIGYQISIIEIQSNENLDISSEHIVIPRNT